MTAPALPQTAQTEVDGVPVLWSPHPGPLTAGLVFRVGRADEQAAQGGTTHVVEHLALHGLDPVLQDHNGQVAALTTTFTVTDEPEAVAAFLARLCRTLRALPLDRLEDERRVLRAEAAGRGRGLLTTLLLHRFGPQGLGLSAYPELALHGVTAEQVQAWASSRFTRGSAALWLTGPPPPGLRLDLPDGPAHPLPALRELEELPAWVPHEQVGLSALVARSHALGPALDVLTRRLWARLRQRDALVYDVSVGAQVVGPGHRLVELSTDPREEDAEQAAAALREELDRLCADGPDAEEVRAVVEVGCRRRREPAAGPAWAASAAVDLLLGGSRDPLDVVDARARTLGPEEVRDALRAVRDAALWALPPGTRSLELRRASAWSSDTLPGQRLAPLPGYEDETEGLVVGPVGLTEVVAEDRRVTVRYDRCVALLRWDDGSRELWGEDGFRLPLSPWEWVEGDRVVREVDAAVPPERHVRVGEGEGPPPAPAPPEPPARTGRRWLLGLGWAFVVFCLALVLTAPAAVDAQTGEDVSCVGDGSSLRVWREGSQRPGSDGEACETAAREDVWFGAAGLVVLLAVAPLSVVEVRRQRRSRTSATTSAVPS